MRLWGARRRALIGVVLLALVVRIWAALLLPTDFDEPVYLNAAFDYAEAMQAGDLNAVIDYPGNPEHPPLVKLLYALSIPALGERATWELALLASRFISAIFGTLAVLLIGLAGGPLAGLLLALHTLTAKYTGQAYLEALPLFASIAAVLAFERSKAARDRWFWLSAIALGLTAASKYAYFPILFPIGYLAWERRSALGLRARDVLLYVAAAAGVFFILNPALWRDPIERLIESLAFHARYTQSGDVLTAAYPWYQPIVWIFQSVPWHPEVFFYFGVDEAVFVLAAIGLVWEWRQRRWLAVWIGAGLIVLLLWPTKWPQYTLVVIPAMCLVAAPAGKRVYAWIQDQLSYWPTLAELLPRPPRIALVATVVFVGALVLIVATGSIRLTLGRLGWSHLTTANSLLPSSTVYDIAAGPGEEMIMGTERGAVIWSPPETSDVPDTWIVFTAKNSGLAHDRVLSVAADASGVTWFGTQSGLSRYDRGEWRSYRAADLGLAQDQVRAIEFGRDGRLWVGTSAGLAVFDGKAWQAYTTTSGLLDDFVMSLAIEPGASGDVVWAGTREGVSRFQAATGEWASYTSGDSQVGGGVADLLIDSSGRLWAATLGGGLGVWDGQVWHSYRTGNSDIPLNEVQHVFEAVPGVLWVGVTFPTETGGQLASFDGETWTLFTPRDSGFSGAEPLSMALDAEGRLWIGTRTQGVDIYRLRER